MSCSPLSCLCSPSATAGHCWQVRSFSVHLPSRLFQSPFPLLLICLHPHQSASCLLQTVSVICHKLRNLHSFSLPAAQETARQMINGSQTLPGLETRYTISLDYVGRHTKSHQLLSYAAACKSGLNRGQLEAGHKMSMGNSAARAVVLPQDPTLLQQLRNSSCPTDRQGSAVTHHSDPLPWELLVVALLVSILS